MTTKKEKGKI